MKERFERGFGWKYGLGLGIGLVSTGWGQDAWQLAASSADLAWVKLILALLTLVPLSVAAGWLAARTVQRFLIQWLVWIAWAILAGFAAGHLPFEPLSAVAGLVDPAARGQAVFPYTSEGLFLTGVAIFFGLVASFPAALFQALSTDWAWDRTTRDGRMTPGAAATLAASLLIGLGLGALDDSMVNSTLREPIVLINRVVQTSFSTPSDLDTSKMPQGQLLEYMAGTPWRGRLSEQFTQYLADYDPNTYASATVDLAFDNELVLRCQAIQYGRYVAGCFDLTAEYRALIPRFLQTGEAQCQNCTAVAAAPATTWQSQHRSEYGDPTQVSVTHHPGGVVVVSIDYGSPSHVACSLVGANPVVIEACGNVGALN